MKCGQGDVIVVGGSVIGCATAFFLTREGMWVRVVEADALGSQVLGVAVGLLAPLLGMGNSGPFLGFGLQGMQLIKQVIPTLEENTDLEVGLCESTHNVARLYHRRRKGVQKRHGLAQHHRSNRIMDRPTGCHSHRRHRPFRHTRSCISSRTGTGGQLPLGTGFLPGRQAVRSCYRQRTRCWLHPPRGTGPPASS